MVETVARRSQDFEWNAPAVAKLMEANGIHDRSELVSSLDDVGQTTVYRVFDENWGGTVTLRMLGALSTKFSVPLTDLVEMVVTDPNARSKSSTEQAVPA